MVATTTILYIFRFTPCQTWYQPEDIKYNIESGRESLRLKLCTSHRHPKYMYKVVFHLTLLHLLITQVYKNLIFTDFLQTRQ